MTVAIDVESLFGSTARNGPRANNCSARHGAERSKNLSATWRNRPSALSYGSASFAFLSVSGSSVSEH